MTDPICRVRRANWDADNKSLTAIRRTVFIEEQHIPETEEWDALDPISQHVLAVADDGTVIGTGRLTPEGKLGRVAVLDPYRRKGVGKAIFEALLDWARELGWQELRIHAQEQAVDFYRNFGFERVGESFFEAGIPHVEMVYHERMTAA